MKILVPVDGSKFSMAALDVAIDYAKTKGAIINLINVMPYIEAVDLEISAHDREKVNKIMEKRADDLVQNACGFLSGNDVTATCRHIVASTSIPDAIIDYAENKRKSTSSSSAARGSVSHRGSRWAVLQQRS